MKSNDGIKTMRFGISDNSEADLISAVKSNDLSRVRLLLQNNTAEINKVNSDGMTALMFAVVNGNLECVRLLLKHGADPKQQDALGVTALMLTCKDDVNVNILKEFMAHTKVSTEMVNVQNHRGTTALMWAAAFGDLEKIKLLFSLGANKQLKDHDGHSAADWAEHGRQAPAFELLTGKKFNPQKRKF